MAKSYTIANGDDLSRVRLALADTSASQAILTDAEIADALTVAGSVAGAVAALARTLAAAALRRGARDVADGYLALADVYDPTISEVSIGTFAPMPFDSGYEDEDG